MRRTGDHGIDGRGTLYKRPANFDSKLAQVKGTRRFNISHLSDFNHVIRRDNAALGCYITLDRVTSRDARTEPRGLGTINYGDSNIFKRVNLWSIADYFDERMPRLPIMNDPYTGKPIYQLDAFA